VLRNSPNLDRRANCGQACPGQAQLRLPLRVHARPRFEPLPERLTGQANRAATAGRFNLTVSRRIWS
jgi:hypothetical protein